MSCLGRLSPRACAQASVVIAAAMLLALLASASPAGAVTITTHPFVSSFDGTGSQLGAFTGLAGVAVSDTTGDIYAIDSGNGVVDQFDPTGRPLAFTTLQLPAGSNALDGSNTPDGPFNLAGVPDVAVDNSGTASDGNIYVDSESANSIYAFDSSGSYLYKITGFSDACGVGVDTTGDVWVGDFAAETLTEFTSAGAPTGTTIDTSAYGNPCHFAFDSHDNVYVAIYQAATEEFDSSGNHLAQLDPGPTASVAVDRSTDHVYVNHGTDVAEYDSTGTEIDTLGAGTLSAASGVAVNSSTGNAASGQVIVSDGALLKVDIFGLLVTQTLPDVVTGDASNLTGTTAHVSGSINPSGVPSTCAFEYGTDTSYGSSAPCSSNPGSGTANVAVQADLSGLTPGTTYHYRLDGTSADGTSNGDDQTFTTPQAPSIDGSSAASGSTTATLKATVNPGGAATTYHFEYGTTTSYGTSAPTPDASAGSGTGDVSASVDVAGLQPGTTYHFRVVATNAAGTVDGPDHTFATLAAAVADTCPNAAVRRQQGSTALPDCRAWELVSQADKARASVLNVSPPSADGNRVIYDLIGGAPGTSNGAFPLLLAQRTASGWTSSSIMPPADQLIGGTYTPNAVSANVDGVIASAYIGATGASDQSPDVAIVRLDAQGHQTLLHRFPMFFGTSGVDLTASDDLSHVYANVPEAIDPSHQPGTWNLYDFGSGSPQLVGTMPSTGLAPTCGLPPTGNGLLGFIGATAIVSEHWASTDGSRVFFQSSGDGAPSCGPLELFTHDRTTGRTTLLSGPPVSGDPDNGVDRFLQATPDGSVAYFRTATSLTAADDADGNSSDMDVYRWTAATGQVECVTCAIPQANVLDPTLVSDDGSHVYFSSVAQYDGAPAGARPGRPNMYVWRNGTIHFIAQTRGISDSTLSTSRDGQATPDGRFAVFIADNPGLNALSGSDNGGLRQYYRYDDSDGSITCLSCPLDGSPAVAQVDTPPINDTFASHAHLRLISDDGSTVAFSTTAALVPQDHNSSSDLYEWHDGRVGLITAGTPGASLPALVSLSPNGHDLFFREITLLTWDAQDASTKLYDARIDGGFLAPPGAPSACQGDQCRGPVSASPTLTDPSSNASGGGGNVVARHLTVSRVSSRQRALFAKTGRLSLGVRVNVAGTVSATATAKLGRHVHTVARASAHARKAGTVTLRLRLSKAARAQLAHGRKLKLTLVVRFGGASKRVTLTLVPATANGR